MAEGGTENPTGGKLPPPVSAAKASFAPFSADPADAPELRLDRDPRRFAPIWLTLGMLLGVVIVIGFVQSWPGFNGRLLWTYVSPRPAKQSEQLPPTRRVLEPTEQIAAYWRDLDSRRRNFDEHETGNDIGQALGYESKLFESAYNELAHYAKTQTRKKGQVSRVEILNYLKDIEREEQAIKLLIVNRDPRTVGAIAYLRDLQHGRASFPNPYLHKPSASETLRELAAEHPHINVEASAAIFTEVYDKVLHLIEVQMQETGWGSIHDIIGEFRRSIVDTARTSGQPNR